MENVITDRIVFVRVRGSCFLSLDLESFEMIIQGCSFLEIQYQGQLRAQLYIGLCHLLTLW